MTRITGLARSAIGLRELAGTAAEEAAAGRTRRPAGGRKKLTETDPTLLTDLQSLVEPTTRGDPMAPLLWTSRSLRNLADALQTMGHRIKHNVVGDLLPQLDYSLRSIGPVLSSEADINRSGAPGRWGVRLTPEAVPGCRPRSSWARATNRTFDRVDGLPGRWIPEAHPRPNAVLDIAPQRYCLHGASVGGHDQRENFGRLIRIGESQVRSPLRRQTVAG
jgi:hypothetical protein